LRAEVVLWTKIRQRQERGKGERKRKMRGRWNRTERAREALERNRMMILLRAPLLASITKKKKKKKVAAWWIPAKTRMEKLSTQRAASG
jgi:hypothetical protein